MTNTDKADGVTEHLEIVNRQSKDPAPAYTTSQAANDVVVEYSLSKLTYVTLFFMSITWGTCTLANVSPSTTYCNAIAEVGGALIES